MFRECRRGMWCVGVIPAVPSSRLGLVVHSTPVRCKRKTCVVKLALGLNHVRRPGWATEHFGGPTDCGVVLADGCPQGCVFLGAVVDVMVGGDECLHLGQVTGSCVKQDPFVQHAVGD
jgi:hypothetical protein